MPIVATESAEAISNDVNDQKAAVDVKDIKDGKFFIRDLNRETL